MTPDYWQVGMGKNGKWVCSGIKTEELHFDAEGNCLSDKPDPIESFEFDTQWAARMHEQFCQRTAQALRHIIGGRDIRWNLDGKLLATHTHGPIDWLNTTARNISMYAFEWRLGNRTVMALDASNQVVTLDLPYIVLAWLRTSAAARALRALWYGWAEK